MSMASNVKLTPRRHRPDNVTEAMIESAEKATEQNKLVTIDLTISDDTKDVEFLELEGHAGL